jgi:hypothetical protein
LARFDNEIIAKERKRRFRDVHASRIARTLHYVGQRDVIGENVEFEAAGADNSAEHRASVDANPHIDMFVVHTVKVLDCDAHGQAESH